MSAGTVHPAAPGFERLRVVLFGATGMVGTAALHACLANEAVESVLVVGRRPCGVAHPKLEERLLGDLHDLAPLGSALAGRNACLFALGVSSVGRSEADYTRDTYDLTVGAAKALLVASPGAAFVYVSGEGTDSTEKGRVMWARVKGRTENALRGLGFHHVALVRLAALVPPAGFRSRVPWIRWSYAVVRPFLPLLRRLLPDGMVLSAPELGRALIAAAQGRADGPVLFPRDLARLGA